MPQLLDEEVSLSKVLNNILKIPQHMNGLQYIQMMALNFAREMNYKCVSIGRICADDPNWVATEVYIVDNEVQPNIRYEIEKTGFEMLRKRVFSCPDFIKNCGVQSLIGAPIFSNDMQTVGVFCACAESPTKSINNAENVIEFLAGRIGVEFERIKADEQMKQINQQLEEIIEVRTAHLRNALAEINLKEQQLELRYNENVNMLRMLSHDLANPLQILGMSIEALSDRVPPELLKIMDRMKRSTDTIGQILHLVRELQAFGAGKKELKLEAVSIDEIIEKSRFNFLDKLKEKNITLNYQSNNSSIKVLAEKVSLSNNIFNNLISNAIKFSENNSSIDISVDQTGELVRVMISDHGIGIPEEMLPYVFAYNRVTSRLGTQGEKGTGFGLPLVKLFLDLYKVKVSVASVTKDQDSNDHGTNIELIFNKAS